MSEAILLAGGLGTRLRSEVGDSPKVLAPVNDQPFILFLLKWLKEQGIARCVLATGYLHEKVYSEIGDEFDGIEIVYSRELTPLGTGGAIRKALNETQNEHLFVLNGDTLFHVNFADLMDLHCRTHADITIGLREMNNISRYGTVKLNEEGRILRFRRKQHVDAGIINGGLYVVRRGLLDTFDLPEKFSFEEDFLQKNYKETRIQGFVSRGYFIDIGVPEDYHRAQKELLEL